jgi:hypothetical protein
MPMSIAQDLKVKQQENLMHALDVLISQHAQVEKLQKRILVKYYL